jgi:hypothetical protein
VKWQYVLNHNCIARQFYFKWWDKFDFTRIRSRLDTEFPLKSEDAPATQAQTPVVQSPKPHIKLPQAPKSESSTFSKGKKPTKKDFKAFALAFAKQFYEASEEEEEDSTTESSTHHNQVDFYQDPLDAYDLGLDF